MDSPSGFGLLIREREVFLQPRELTKLFYLLVNNTRTWTMPINICLAQGKNEKAASNTSQLPLSFPVSLAWNIISFRAQVGSQIALFPKEMSVL